MKRFKNGTVRYDAKDMQALKPSTEPLTDGQASFLAAIVGAPDPTTHPEEFKAWRDEQAAMVEVDPPARTAALAGEPKREAALVQHVRYMREDPMTLYAEHFKMSRREAKSRLFHLVYGRANIDVLATVKAIIAQDKKNSEHDDD